MRVRREGPGTPDMMRAMSRVWMGGVSGHGLGSPSPSSDPDPSRAPSGSNAPPHFLFRPSSLMPPVFRWKSTLNNANWNTALSKLASPYSLRQHTGTPL